MAITAKFVFEGDVRRTSIQTVSVDTLVAAATEIFASQLSNPFDLLYADDEGDLCALVPETFGDWAALHDGLTCARFHIRIRNENASSVKPRPIDDVPDVRDVPGSLRPKWKPRSEDFRLDQVRGVPGSLRPLSLEPATERILEEFTIYSDCEDALVVAETTSTCEAAHEPEHSDMCSTLPVDMAVPVAGGESAETEVGCQQENHELKPIAEVQDNQADHKAEKQAESSSSPADGQQRSQAEDETSNQQQDHWTHRWQHHFEHRQNHLINVEQRSNFEHQRQWQQNFEHQRHWQQNTCQHWQSARYQHRYQYQHDRCQDHCFNFLTELHAEFSNTSEPMPNLIELVPKALQFLQGREAMVDSETAKQKKYVFQVLWALVNCLNDYFPEFSGPSHAFKRVLKGDTTEGLGAASVAFLEKMALQPTEIQETIFAILWPCLVETLSGLGPPSSGCPSDTSCPAGPWQIPQCFTKGMGKDMGKAKGKGKWNSNADKESYYPDLHERDATADNSESGDDSLSSDSSDESDTPCKHGKKEWKKARKDLKQKLKAQIKALKQQRKVELSNLKKIYMESKHHGACSGDLGFTYRNDSLQSLTEMGFNDRELNLRFLEKHSYHLGRVIDALVNGEQL